MDDLSVQHQRWLQREQQRLQAAMQEIADEEVAAVKQSLSQPSPPPSAPGQPPHMVTGRLRESVHDAVSKGALAVQMAVYCDESAGYAQDLEFGNEHQAPRPFMRPAYERLKQTFAARLKAKLGG